MGYNTHVHGSNARNFSVLLFLSQTSKNAMSLLLCFLLNKIREQEGRTGSAHKYCWDKRGRCPK
jgi:hypothetical protein